MSVFSSVSNLLNDLTYFVDFSHWHHAVPALLKKIRRMFTYEEIRHAHLFYMSIFVRIVEEIEANEIRPLLWEENFLPPVMAFLKDPVLQAAENVDILHDLITVLV